MEVSLKGIAGKVKFLLETYPDTKESDNTLIKHIWSEQCEKLNICTTNDFFKHLTLGTFINYESVRRVRQKLQETYPELRGVNYSHKKKKQGIIVGDLSSLLNEVPEIKKV